MTYGKFLKITTFSKNFIHISFYKNKIAIPKKLYTKFSLQHVDVTAFITHFLYST